MNGVQRFIENAATGVNNIGHKAILYFGQAVQNLGNNVVGDVKGAANFVGSKIPQLKKVTKTVDKVATRVGKVLHNGLEGGAYFGQGLLAGATNAVAKGGKVIQEVLTGGKTAGKTAGNTSSSSSS